MKRIFTLFALKTNFLLLAFLCVAVLGKAQTLDPAFNTGTGANGSVNALVVQPDGKILIGGPFTTYNGIARNRIARLNSDGSLDNTFDPGSGTSSSVAAIALQPDGKILIGGAFTSYNGTSRNTIARVNSDGSLDNTFNPGSGASAQINSMVVQSDGKILIGGSFTSYNGTVRNSVARINSDGSLDNTFNPGTGTSGGAVAVNFLTVQSDGKILIGGTFTTYNGTARTRIARINSDGSLDNTFDPGTGANNTVRAITVQSDGKILIGGAFSSYNGTARNTIARINSDGSLDNTFDPGSGGSSNILSILRQSDGKILIGGQFSTYNGTARKGIARINSDGSLDNTFDPGAGANGTVFALVIQSDGNILIGGFFSSYDGTAINNIARLVPPCTSPAITTDPSNSTICSGNNTSFTVAATGTSVTYQWQENTGGGFSNITNGGVYGGATTTTLALSGATAGMNGYTYRSVATACATSVNSNSATLTVNALPAITLHPSNSTICSGANASFSVTATGAGVSYQWQESINNGGAFSNVSNGGVYSNATSAVLNLTAAPASMNTYQYRCVISGTCVPSVTSNAATLTVNAATSITAQPLNASSSTGGNVTFGIAASGSGLTYQWQEIVSGGIAFNNISNGGMYGGATTVTLFINGTTQSMNNYRYRCVVTGTCGASATSGEATMTVTGGGSGSGANITSQPSDNSTCEGNTVTFSVTVENQSGYTYQWQEIINDSVYQWITDGGVYSGAATPTLHIASVNSSMNAHQYRCDVGGKFSDKAKLTVNTAPTITEQPTNTTVCSGNPASFSITAPGTGVVYQWQESQDGGASFNAINDSTMFSDVTSSVLTIKRSFSWMNARQYRCVVSRSSCSTISSYAIVTVHPTPDTTVIVSGQNFFANATACAYQWLDCGNSFAPISGETNQSFVASQSGNYCVALRTNGCADTSACYRVDITGVNEKNVQPGTLMLYPNPTSGSVTIDAGESGTIIGVTVTNALGQILFSLRAVSSKTLEVPLHDVPAGMYFFRIETPAGVQFEHVVKQ